MRLNLAYCAAAPVVQEPTDDQLVESARGGDGAAFSELVRRHEREVWKIAAAAASDRLATENLVQECFLTAYRNLDRYRSGPGSDVGAWLRTVARNLVRNELRRLARETRRLSDYRTYVLALWSEERVEEEQRALERAVAECRQKLAPTVVRALELRYDEALSLEDVAAALGRTVAATRQLLFRGRVAIRRCLDKEHDE